MKFLSNKIISNINFDMQMEKRTYDQTEEFYVNNARKVKIEGVTLKIKLQKEDFNKIFNKLYMNPTEYNVIEREEATDFIRNNVVGNITKKDLDERVKKEKDDADMLQD